jgi:acetyl-CoA carboxylase biotin carboxylase subunit
MTTPRTIKKILIANRGEIAVRIMRACREMGIQSVAVFSEADRTAAHVRLADEAYCIGEPPSAKSYLVMDRIIETAKQSNADAIHPGYGFLSENDDFARLVRDNGIIFIGPSAESMAMMGNKMEARKLAKKCKVPTVPGTEEGIKNKNDAIKIAESIGFPVLIKAAAGGGGKGMRVVNKLSELSESIDRAQGEARSAFGDDTVYIEKYVTKPRHIEIQVLGDTHGHIVYLGERECSIQRRHQKVIEECPSAIVTPEMRRRMGESALALAREAQYYSAGTLEFLVDADLNYYFLEMNTRLQVEHPVTERVTGIDIVKEQIRIAAGEILTFKQEDIHIRGHAIECRIYAEDCENNFAPSIGKIEHLEPSYGPGIREDSGIFEGDTIQIYYDPMISKLVAWGKDRNEAIHRMKRALAEYAIVGVETTIPFCLFVMENQKFISGDFDTGFVAQEFSPEKLKYKEEKIAAAAAAVYDYMRKKSQQSHAIAVSQSAGKISRWKLAGRKHR